MGGPRVKEPQWLRRFIADLTESDEARYARELRAWAASIPGTVRIAEAPLRSRVRIAGEVQRITLRPEIGNQAYEVMLYDGTGEIRVVWLGRRPIPGVTLGSRVLVEGVVGEERGERKMTDPQFEILPPERHVGFATWRGAGRADGSGGHGSRPPGRTASRSARLAP